MTSIDDGLIFSKFHANRFRMYSFVPMFFPNVYLIMNLDTALIISQTTDDYAIIERYRHYAIRFGAQFRLE